MVAKAARDMVLQWGDESPPPEVAGIREFTVTHEGEAMDITNNDSAGRRQVLVSKGVKGETFSISGVTLDDTLRQDWHNDSVQQNAIFTYPDGATLTFSGTSKLHLQSYEESGDHENPGTFSATFISHGKPTYAAAA